MKKTLLLIAVTTIMVSKTITAGENPKVKKVFHGDSSAVLFLVKNEKQSTLKKFTWHQMFTNLPSDYYKFIKTGFNKKEIPAFLSLALLTGSFMAVDQVGWKFQHSLYNKSILVHKTSDIAVGLGNGKYQFLASAVFAATGVILHNEKLLKTSSNIFEAILSTGLFVQLLKRITGRQSPAASTENGGDWDPFPSIKQYQKDQPAFYSFPSGHLSTATAIFTVIANNYPNEKWIKPVGYSLLGILGFSLVNKGMHWYSDLPLAYFIGYTFGNIIAPPETVSRHDKESTNIKQLLLSPFLNSKGAGLNIVYTF